MLSYPGYLTLLNVCALLASVLLVTAPAAALAAQVTLHRWLDLDDTRIVQNFVREFRRQVPRLVLWGAGALAFVVVMIVAVEFWLSVTGPRQTAGLLCLAMVFVTAVAGCLAWLEIAARAPAAGPRVWFRSVPATMVARPARAAGAIVVVLTWFTLMHSLPPLALGWGLVVPAMLARWAFSSTAATFARTSDADSRGVRP